MKKVIYITLLAFTSATVISSCTEEEVTPNVELNGGGAAMDPK